MTALRPNGLPHLRDLPIRFTRCAATTDFSKFVGKETDHAKHSPYEYISEDGCWIIRSVHHTGRGSTNSGRVRWHVVHNGRYFMIGRGTGSSSAITREDAIDEIHRKIARGFYDGFKVIARMREDAEKHEREEARRVANLVRAKDLIGRVYGADPDRLIEQIAKHVDLDTLARAVDSACQLVEDI